MVHFVLRVASLISTGTICYLGPVTAYRLLEINDLAAAAAAPSKNTDEMQSMQGNVE